MAQISRNEASRMLRDLLNEHGLQEWHVRLSSDIRGPLGLCSYKDKCIILNGLHIDSHPDVEVINTIRHEVAHALMPGHGHDATWAAKARELGCDNVSPCASYGFSPEVIDAIRSGADVQVTFEEQVIRTPKYTITRLQDKCYVCGKVAKTVKQIDTGSAILTKYECGHIHIKKVNLGSAFDTITFDGKSDCKHAWPADGKSRTICSKCGAKRLFKYQIEGARAIEKADGRFAIFDEMGLGKTIQVLAYLKFHQEDAWPFLWVTKSGIKYQHMKEIMRVLGPKAFPQVLKTGGQGLVEGMNCIASYDIFRRVKDLDMFKQHGFKSIILDEVQAIKNPDSSRTQCIRRVVKDIPKVIPLSGSPWKNRGTEYFTVLNLLDPKMFYSNQMFINRYVETYFEGSKVKYGGIRNPEKFREQISHIAVRRERAEVMPELPLISRVRTICEVPDWAKEAYNKSVKDLKDGMKDFILEGTEDSFAAQASAMVHLTRMRQVVGMAKIDTTCEMAQEHLEETDRKLVIFVHHIACGDAIFNKMEEFCRENGYPLPVRITGGMASEDRFAIQEKFNNGARLMIASELASGEGLNLQTCSDCIMHERQWNPMNEEQCEGRFVRIGQMAQAITARYMHADGTVDAIFDEIVEQKRINFHNTMNKGEMIEWSETSIIKSIIQNVHTI